MTQKTIGPTFYDELVTYETANKITLIGTHFSWDEAGNLYFFDDTPDGVEAAVEAVYAAHDPSKVPVATQASDALAAGLAVTSTGTPELSGTYAVDSTAQTSILSQMVSILTLDTFSNGTGSMDWADTSGALHTFTIAQFKTLAAAISSYTNGVNSFANGATTALPAATATIA